MKSFIEETDTQYRKIDVREVLAPLPESTAKLLPGTQPTKKQRKRPRPVSDHDDDDQSDSDDDKVSVDFP